jgi:hypothetical protein
MNYKVCIFSIIPQAEELGFSPTKMLPRKLNITDN